MPTYTIKPVSGVSLGSSVALAPTGTSDAIAALGDASDTTYDKVPSASLPAYATGQWLTGVPAAFERIVSMVPYARAKAPGGQVPSVAVGSLQGAPPYGYALGVALSIPAGQSAAANYAVLPHLGQLLDPLSGGEWLGAGSQYQHTPLLAFRDPNYASNPTLFYEAGFTVYTLKPATIAAPTVSPTSGGTNNTSQYPTFAAVVSALVESWQLRAGGEFCTTGRVEFSVYRSADAGAGASPPAGVTPVMLQVVPFDLDTYIDGITLSTLTVSLKAPAPLPDDSYVVYARVVRDHPSGLDTLPSGTSAWSAYQRLAWTQAVGGPYAPSGLTIATASLQAMELDVLCTGPAAYNPASCVVYVERLVGGVWRAVRGMTGVPVAYNTTVPLGYDYECDRAVTNTYRFRQTMVLSADGTLASSPWRTYTVAGPNPIGTGWNLKAVNLPAASWLSAGILTEPAESDQTQATIFYPLDRDYPVVVKGSAGGWTGSYDFIASGVAAVAALRALIDYEGLILMETAFGDAFYCSETGCSIKRQGTSPSPRLAGTLTFAQVDCDLLTES